MNLNKIVKQLRGDHKFVAMNSSGKIYGFKTKPISGGTAWQGEDPVKLCQIEGDFSTNWRHMIWDFSEGTPNKVAEIGVSQPVHVQVHHFQAELPPHSELQMQLEMNPALTVYEKSPMSLSWTPTIVPQWCGDHQYRLVEHRRVPMGGNLYFMTGLTEGLKTGDNVWFSSIAASSKATKIQFDAENTAYQEMLKRGILHYTPAAAVMMTEALLSITKVK